MYKAKATGEVSVLQQRYVLQLTCYYDDIPTSPKIKTLDEDTWMVGKDNRWFIIKTEDEPESIKSIERLHESLKYRGFSSFVPILLTDDYMTTIKWGRQFFYAKPHYYKADLTQKEVVAELAQTVASLHHCTEAATGNIMLHGNLTAEAVRIDLNGNLVLDHWDMADYNHSVHWDIADVIYMLDNPGRDVIAHIIENYASVRQLAPKEIQYLVDDMLPEIAGSIIDFEKKQQKGAEKEQTTSHSADTNTRQNVSSLQNITRGGEKHMVEKDSLDNSDDKQKDEEKTKGASAKSEKDELIQKSIEEPSEQTESSKENESGPIKWNFPPPLTEEEPEDVSEPEEEKVDEDEQDESIDEDRGV